MRAVPGPDEAARAKVAAVDPAVRLVDTHRVQTERSIQRYLADLAAKHPDLGLDLSGLPPLPPTSIELQRWFLEAETKEAFLQRVRAAWAGDLGSLDLPFYATEGASTSWQEEDLGRVAAWPEETYRVRRKTTQEMVGR
jgi:hypothetical protein